MRAAGVLAAATVIATLADCTTTLLCLRRGFVEGNPGGASLLISVSPALWVLVSLVLAAALAGVLILLDRMGAPASILLVVAWWPIAVRGWASLSNLALLLGLPGLMSDALYALVTRMWWLPPLLSAAAMAAAIYTRG